MEKPSTVHCQLTKERKIMARELIKEKIKQIVTILKKEPANWSDLKKITSLADKTLDCYLHYLEYWGFVQKSDNGWQWFENIRTYETEHDYQLAINHSRKLIDTLGGFFPLSIDHSEWFKNKKVLPIKTNDELILCDMVRDHLKTGYPKIYSEILVFEELIEQRNLLAESLGEYNSKIEKVKLIEFVANFTVLKSYVIPKAFRKEVEKIVKAIGPDRLSLIEKAHKNYVESLMKTSNELRHLTFVVEHGEPLLGTCEFCPKSKISQSK